MIGRALPLLLGVLALCSGCAATAPPAGAGRVVALEEALAAGEGDPYELNVALAEACLDVVNHPLTGGSDKLEFSKQALVHADRAIELEEDRVEGHFLRAVSVGQVLDHSLLPDLGLIDDLEQSGIRARELDPSYACAGPLRLLALLYQKAPAWPIGPELAGELEEIEALELAPKCPENHLAYAEFLLEEDRRKEARVHARQAKAFISLCDLGVERDDIARRIHQLLAALQG